MRRKYYPDGDGLYLVLYPPRPDEPPKKRGPQPKNGRPTKLTDVRVRNLAKDRKSAYWVYRYMLGRKQRNMGLGPYPEITLKRAREKALQARTLKVERTGSPTRIVQERPRKLSQQEATVWPSEFRSP